MAGLERHLSLTCWRWSYLYLRVSPPCSQPSPLCFFLCSRNYTYSIINSHYWSVALSPVLLWHHVPVILGTHYLFNQTQLPPPPHPQSVPCPPLTALTVTLPFPVCPVFASPAKMNSRDNAGVKLHRGETDKEDEGLNKQSKDCDFLAQMKSLL